MGRLTNLDYQYDLDSGKPNAGGKLFFRISGTNTDQDTFSDKLLTMANLNPIVLNSAGKLPVNLFLSPSLYRVIEQDSLGNQLSLKDNIVEIIASGDNLTIGELILTGRLIGDDVTQSVSTATGAIQTDGGLGVVKDAFIGGGLNVAGVATLAVIKALVVNEDSTLNGDLDIIDGTISGLRLGADADLNTRTNATNKRAHIVAPHFTAAEEDVLILQAISDLGVTRIQIGGGNVGTNAATEVSLYTGATTTTLTGVEALQADSSQNITIPNGRLSVVNDIDQGVFSNTGATRGVNITIGQLQTSQTLTASRNHYTFFNPNGLVGRIETVGSSTLFVTASDPDLKTDFVTIDGYIALGFISEAVEQKYLGEFYFKTDLTTKVWGYNAWELVDNQPGFGGTDRHGPRNMAIGDVYQEQILEQTKDDDGNLLFTDVTETRQRQKTVKLPIMHDVLIPAIFEKQDIDGTLIQIELKPERIESQQVTEPVSVLIEEQIILDGAVQRVIPEHYEDQEQGIFEIVGIVDETGAPVTEDYQFITGKEPVMVEVQAELKVQPAAVDQSKRIPMLEAAIYELLQKIIVLESKI